MQFEIHIEEEGVVNLIAVKTGFILSIISRVMSYPMYIEDIGGR